MSFYSQDISGSLQDTIGSDGLSDRELEQVNVEATAALAKLQSEINLSKLAFANLGEAKDQLVKETEETYERLSDGARTIMFFGCGEAGLIGQAIAQFGGWSIPGVMSGTQRKRPVTRFYSTPDPVTMNGALGRSDLERTRFVFVSKTGDVSTVAQAMAALEAVRQSGHGDAIPRLFLIVTDAARSDAKNGLQELGKHFGIPCLNFPTEIDEGFAAFTTAGLLPAAARGMDIRKIISGAEATIADVQLAEPSRMAATVQAAAIAVGLGRYRDRRQQVIMPFDDRLAELARFWAQLASSRQGSGDAAVACCGPQARRTFLQSTASDAPPGYLTVIRTSTTGAEPLTPADLAEIADVESLAESSLGTLLEAEQQATIDLLKENRQPVRVLTVPQLDESVLGSLLMHMMLEVMLTAYMRKTDPFLSPTVNQIDIKTIARLHSLRD